MRGKMQEVRGKRWGVKMMYLYLATTRDEKVAASGRESKSSSMAWLRIPGNIIIDQPCRGGLAGHV